jgi:phage terminase small subunit
MLTTRQQLFVEAYLGAARLNASRAAALAGYENPYVLGHQLRHKPHIAEAIRKRLEEQAAPQEEIIAVLSAHVRGSLKPFLRPFSAELDLTTDEAQANIHLLKKVKITTVTGGSGDEMWEKTTTEFVLHDPQKAADILAKLYHLYGKDKVTVNVKILSLILDTLPDDQRQRVIQALREEFGDGGSTLAITAQSAMAESHLLGLEDQGD